MTTKKSKQYFTWFKDETIMEALKAHTEPFESLSKAVKDATLQANPDSMAFVVIDETHETVFDSEKDNIQVVLAQVSV